MNKFKAVLASAALVMGAQSAYAAGPAPSGPHVFSGPVSVQKDGLAYNCTLTVTVNVNAAGTATATAALSGAFPCGAIAISGTGTVIGDNTIRGFVIDPPLSAGLCNGDIKFVWGGNTATPRTIGLSSPLSDMAATSGASCKMIGTLTNTSPSPNTLTLP